MSLTSSTSKPKERISSALDLGILASKRSLRSGISADLYFCYNLGRIPDRRQHVLSLQSVLFGNFVNLHATGQRSKNNLHRYPETLDDRLPVSDLWIDDYPILMHLLPDYYGDSSLLKIPSISLCLISR